MSGRSSRARLLAPSFLVVASAIACGGHSRGDDAGGSGGGTSGGSGAFGGTNFGGSSNPPPSTCPVVLPANGAACFGAISCSYPMGGPAFCPPSSSTASCVSGAWMVAYQLASCNPPMPFQCPPTLPTEGSPCPGFGDPNMVCSYAASECPAETARCLGTWTVSRCEPLGGEGGQPPSVGGAPDGIGGAFDATGGFGGSP